MLSYSQQEILSILKNRTWRAIGLLTHRSEEHRVKELCRKLEAAPPHFIIPPLAAILISFPIKLRPLICHTFQHLVRAVSPDQWNFIDQEIRHEIQALIYQLNHTKQPLPVPNLKDPIEQLIALSHPSGITREHAIIAINSPIDEATLNLLLLRCIDWATPVALSAQSKLSTLPSTFFENRINDLLDIFFLIQRSSRPISLTVQDQLERIILSQPGWSESLLSTLEQSRNPNRRQVASLLLIRHVAQLPEDHISRFLSHGPPAQVLILLRRSQTLSLERLRLVLDYTQTASAAPIRRERLRLLGRLDLKDSQLEFEAALSDPSKSIRSVARFHLQEWTNDDFANHYQQQLNDRLTPRKFRAILMGLSEIAPERAHSIAFNLLTDAKHPAALKTCILCLNLLSDEISDSLILSWLQSPSISVAHAIFRQIISHDLMLPEDELGAMISRLTLPAHSRNFAMKLLNQTNKWTSLDWALQGSASGFPEVSELANWKLQRWLFDYNRTAIHTTDEELKRVVETFRSVQHHLEPELSANLEFLLERM